MNHLSSSESDTEVEPEEAADEAAPEQNADEGAAADAPSDDTPAEDAPTDAARTAMVDLLRRELADGLVDHHLDAGRDLWVRVATDAWEPVGRAARDVLGCGYFCFLSVIDWLPSPFGRSMDSDVDTRLGAAAERQPKEIVRGVTGGDTRMQVFARLYSIPERLGITLKADIPDDTVAIATWTKLFGGANWHEREAYEMFGVTFTGHPSLRKLYLPGAFEGHPMRKDFPLLARIVRPWPGIVDVEAMPGEDEAGADEAGEDEAAAVANGEGEG